MHKNTQLRDHRHTPPRGGIASELLASEGRAALMKALHALLYLHEPEPSPPEPWDLTMPASLGRGRLAEPFDEPLYGMAVREVREPSIFRRFFGR